MRHLRGSQFINFQRVSNETWIKDNVVLMGDAAHTAHFSIGSGTKLALEDAIGLAARSTAHGTDIPAALAAYEAERRVEVLKLQSAARNSTEWFENVARYAHLEPEQFAYQPADPQPADQPREPAPARPPVAGGHGTLARRSRQRRHPRTARSRRCSCRSNCATCNSATAIVVSPMATYSARDGMPNDFHLVHLGARALGGASLVFTEMICVTPQGRITPGCAGIVQKHRCTPGSASSISCMRNSPAKICLQLGHSGLKGSTQLGWEDMDEPLAADNWELIAPSAGPLEPAQPDPASDDAHRYGRGARRLRAAPRATRSKPAST